LIFSGYLLLIIAGHIAGMAEKRVQFHDNGRPRIVRATPLVLPKGKPLCMDKSSFIPVSAPDVSGNEKRYVSECIDSGWVSSVGEFVRRFENDFARYCNCRYGATVNTGTAALHLALRALNIGPGDEVILPALTFASTANVILYQNATPVFADSGVGDWNIDPAQLAGLVTSRTRAIIPVHLYGQPCDMDPIMKLAEERKLHVIEDCAEAHGALYDGNRVGSIGHVGCFSFYGNKIITTGEGGMCVTNDAALHERMCMLRDHAMDKSRRYWHKEVGFNYRMTNLQAAVGCAQLEKIDEFVEKKRWIKEQYNVRLQGLDCVLPSDPARASGVFWLYTLLLPTGTGEKERDSLISFLRENEVESRPVFYPITAMPPYRQYDRPVPNATSIAARGITLPSFYRLTEKQIDRVAGLVRAWLHGSG
jgi:perosamine synthetase